MTDIVIISTANLGFSTTLGDYDNDRQPEMAILTFRASILPFPAVRCCRDHLTTLLSISSWSKMPDLPLEFRRCHTFEDISRPTSGLGFHLSVVVKLVS